MTFDYSPTSKEIEKELKPVCKRCGKPYEPWIAEGSYENHLCLPCNSAKWKEWEVEEADNLKRIKEIQSKGHSHHCACRQVWGDGECECDLYEKGYDPYAWIKKSPEIEKELVNIEEDYYYREELIFGGTVPEKEIEYMPEDEEEE